MSKSNGRIWPYAIGASITLVFGFCVATIIVTQKANIQTSDAYMTYYQDADANINDLIEARIAFDKKYKIKYISKGIAAEGSTLSYKVTDLNDKVINNATVILSTSRPEMNDFNQNLDNPTVENGIYTFSDLKFPKAGVWNLIAKVQIGDNYRFYNIKADTRNTNSYEF